MKTTIPGRLLQRVRALLFALALFGVSDLSAAGGGLFVSVAIAPPPIPVYVQPAVPAPGYIWTPGYWAYGPDGYYWVPGMWVLPPYVGALWTPGYWGWSDGLYVWNDGYWGTSVGFYGGINYGFGYTGYGYYGGYWSGSAFYYNQAANNVSPAVVHNTYNTPINSVTASRASYNGGTGGTLARPDAAQRASMSQPHTAATSVQVQHQQVAASQRTLLASVNQGRPASAATPTAGARSRAGAAPTTSTPARNVMANAGAHTQPERHASSSHAASAGGAPQGQPKVYAQPQPHRQVAQGGPTAHPGNAPQGHAKAAPQRYAQVAPQGQAKAAPQRYAQAAPQGHPQAGPQGHPQVAMLGHRQAQSEGGPNGSGGGEGHHGK